MGASISLGNPSLVDNASNSDEKPNGKMEGRRSEAADRCELSDSFQGSKRGMWKKEGKIALLQDVDKLRKKLKLEENVHRALERALTKPLALPRLPPNLPSHILELLAEVAVLEKEVLKLEEQVLNFRQCLYHEAIYISSTKRIMENGTDLCHVGFSSQKSKNSEQSKAQSLLANSDPSTGSNSPSMRWYSDRYPNQSSSNRFANEKRFPMKLISSFAEDSIKNIKQTVAKKASGSRVLDSQQEFLQTNKEKVSEDINDANKLSEEILRCLLSILARISLPKSTAAENKILPSVLVSCDNLKDEELQDPYSICTEFGRRDIGPYKHLHAVDSSSFDNNIFSKFSSLYHRLKLLLGKLASVCISELTHQQKLAFWINMYNSCMMNAFLENGMPTKPETIIALMSKAMVNVGGQLLSAMTIEHFILRLPYHWKQQLKGEAMTRWSIFGLDRPDPLVTFALSCGSWSSPAVRIYTASQVEQQLEESKRDYLQASIGISKPSQMAIPKLLDWYHLDFAKDMESLMDWICLQLPSELRKDAVQCLDMRRRSAIPRPIQVLPYEFRFRYLLEP
ncbi:uncharacterized protein LOC110027864 [Phalaenopsis equestris]|uniref:uncharacterized protein LOC110027864 n=1 Tax=Phalaenopsis equestris TaxID=78828 RepID=UPI0009E6314F|nr:uncharacterized protein LOC110027864 [Phalaenopsis equestris]